MVSSNSNGRDDTMKLSQTLDSIYVNFPVVYNIYV